MKAIEVSDDHVATCVLASPMVTVGLESLIPKFVPSTFTRVRAAARAREGNIESTRGSERYDSSIPITLSVFHTCKPSRYTCVGTEPSLSTVQCEPFRETNASLFVCFRLVLSMASYEIKGTKSCCESNRA